MVLFRNVRVIDGDLNPEYKADVLVSNGSPSLGTTAHRGKILQIGDLKGVKVAQTVAGNLGYLMPGLLDIYSRVDHSFDLMHNFAQKNYLDQGVTSIILGHQGSSLAPLLYGSLECLKKWGGKDGVCVGWHNVKEFLHYLKQQKLGVILGTLVGRGTMRGTVFGEVNRGLTENELKILNHITEESLKEGALGVSFGLNFAHTKNTAYEEVRDLALLAAKYNKVCEVQIRGEGEAMYEALNEAWKIYEETAVKMVIIGVKPYLGSEADFDRAFELFAKRARGTNCYLLLDWSEDSFRPVYSLLPEVMRYGSLGEMCEDLKNKYKQEEVLKHWGRLSPDFVKFVSAQNLHSVCGKTLGEVAANRGLSLGKALIEVMLQSHLRASVLIKNVNLEKMEEVVGHENVLVGGTLASHGVANSGVFLDLIERVLRGKKISLEKLINKLTAQVYDLYGVKGGRLKVGERADLCLLLNNEMRSVVVDGRLVKNQERFLKSGSFGRVIS